MGQGPTNRAGSQSNYISTATTTNVTTARSVLRRIVLGETAAGAITIQDKNAVVVGVLKASIAEGTYEFDVTMAGITVITAGASKLTVVYD